MARFIREHGVTVLAEFQHAELGRVFLVVGEYSRDGMLCREVELVPYRYVEAWLGY